jgi:hypothetical protein
MVLCDGLRAREHFQAALRASINIGQAPVQLVSMAGIAELLTGEGDLNYAARLAMLVMNHPASQAKVKERAERILVKLEAQLSSNDLVAIHESSRQSDLDSVAAQLLVDLRTP